MLELSLELNNTAESLKATFILRNTGQESLLVNKRLMINHPTEIEECREVYLVIRNRAGVELPFNAFLRVGELNNSDFSELAPGKSVQATYNLNDYYSFSRPEQYTVQAVYQNPFDPSTGPAWKGTLESNTVSVSLK